MTFDERLFKHRVTKSVLIVTPFLIPLSEWIALSSWSNGFLADLRTLATFICLVILLVCFSLLITGLAGVGFKRYRKTAISYLITGVLGIGSVLLSGKAANVIWHKSFSSVANRSKDLIAAIRAYEEAEGKPPKSLGEMVPKYIPEIPDTGIGAHPKFEYRAPSWIESEPWQLSVFTPTGLINWDEFLYLPSQNYQLIHASHTPIGDWVYVHE